MRVPVHRPRDCWESVTLVYEPFRPPDEPTPFELELLQDVVALTAELGGPPHLSQLAADFGITRQGVYHHVRKMRKKGLLEDEPRRGSKVGVVLSHNGLRAVERAMSAE